MSNAKRFYFGFLFIAQQVVKEIEQNLKVCPWQNLLDLNTDCKTTSTYKKFMRKNALDRIL